MSNTRRPIPQPNAWLWFGLGVTVAFGFLPPDAPPWLHVLGMFCGAVTIIFAVAHLTWAGRWAKAVAGVAERLDLLIREADAVFRDEVQARRAADAGASTFGTYQARCANFVEANFGVEERDAMLAAHKKNLFVTKEFPAGEAVTAVYVLQAHLERLRGRLLLGRVPLASGEWMPE